MLLQPSIDEMLTSDALARLRAGDPITRSRNVHGEMEIRPAARTVVPRYAPRYAPAALAHQPVDEKDRLRSKYVAALAGKIRAERLASALSSQVKASRRR
jgi:hypothetical protein